MQILSSEKIQSPLCGHCHPNFWPPLEVGCTNSRVCDSEAIKGSSWNQKRVGFSTFFSSTWPVLRFSFHCGSLSFILCTRRCIVTFFSFIFDHISSWERPPPSSQPSSFKQQCLLTLTTAKWCCFQNRLIGESQIHVPDLPVISLAWVFTLEFNANVSKGSSGWATLNRRWQ